MMGRRTPSRAEVLARLYPDPSAGAHEKVVRAWAEQRFGACPPADRPVPAVFVEGFRREQAELAGR